MLLQIKLHKQLGLLARHQAEPRNLSPSQNEATVTIRLTPPNPPTHNDNNNPTLIATGAYGKVFPVSIWDYQAVLKTLQDPNVLSREACFYVCDGKARFGSLLATCKLKYDQDSNRRYFGTYGVLLEPLEETYEAMMLRLEVEGRLSQLTMSAYDAIDIAMDLQSYLIDHGDNAKPDNLMSPRSNHSMKLNGLKPAPKRLCLADGSNVAVDKHYNSTSFAKDLKNLVIALIRPFIAPLRGNKTATANQAQRLLQSGDVPSVQNLIFPESEAGKMRPQSDMEQQLIGYLFQLYSNPPKAAEIKSQLQVLLSKIGVAVEPFPFAEGANSFWLYLCGKFNQIGKQPSISVYGNIAVDFQLNSPLPDDVVTAGEVARLTLRALDSYGRSVEPYLSKLAVSVTGSTGHLQVHVEVLDLILSVSFSPAPAGPVSLCIQDIDSKVKYTKELLVVAPARSQEPRAAPVPPAPLVDASNRLNVPMSRFDGKGDNPLEPLPHDDTEPQENDPNFAVDLLDETPDEDLESTLRNEGEDKENVPAIFHIEEKLDERLASFAPDDEDGPENLPDGAVDHVDEKDDERIIPLLLDDEEEQEDRPAKDQSRPLCNRQVQKADSNLSVESTPKHRVVPAHEVADDNRVSFSPKQRRRAPVQPLIQAPLRDRRAKRQTKVHQLDWPDALSPTSNNLWSILYNRLACSDAKARVRTLVKALDTFYSSRGQDPKQSHDICLPEYKISRPEYLLLKAAQLIDGKRGSSGIAPLGFIRRIVEALLTILLQHNPPVLIHSQFRHEADANGIICDSSFLISIHRKIEQKKTGKRQAGEKKQKIEVKFTSLLDGLLQLASAQHAPE